MTRDGHHAPPLDNVKISEPALTLTFRRRTGLSYHRVPALIVGIERSPGTISRQISQVRW